MAASPPLLAIIGPTASGKSELAAAVARAVGAEILSADSMQVYRGMDIGTAKPTAAERAAIVHHLLDIVDPDQPFTVARFVELADAAIADAAARGVPLIVTGGTPLYFKALFEGLFQGPPADPALRQRLMDMGGAELHARLSAVDPQAAARIHPNDIKRMVRALEVFELTGRPISAWQTQWSAPSVRHAATWIGLMWQREQLNRRINARVRAMLAAGWVDETRRLLQRYGRLSHTAAEATGYRQIMEHLAGRLSLEEAAEQIKIATRQLARRQMKWFRRFANVRWLAGDAPLEANVRAVLAAWAAVR
jgi:tRNA dimethylallyltransferase